MDDDVLVENLAKASLARGESVVGTMVCELRSIALPRMLARAGLDFVIFDSEHGVFTTETLADLAAASRVSGVTPIVRIPEIRKESVSRTFDVGAQGILVPQVRHEDEVREVVRFAKYAPLGERGVALGRTHSDYLKGNAAEWMARLNVNTMVIIQIETGEAVERLDEIASVPGIDALFIGPNDLASSLGVPGAIDHPRMVEVFDRVIEAAGRSGIAAGVHLFDVETAKHWKEKGMRFITLSNDITMIIESARTIVSALG